MAVIHRNCLRNGPKLLGTAGAIGPYSDLRRAVSGADRLARARHFDRTALGESSILSSIKGIDTEIGTVMMLRAPKLIQSRRNIIHLSTLYLKKCKMKMWESLKDGAQ